MILTTLTRMTYRLFILTFTTTFFFSCLKNDDPDVDNFSPAPDLSTNVNSSVVSGFVTYQNDYPVSGATVQVGSGITTTDKFGYFEIRNVQVIQNAAKVTVSKPGYFKCIKTYIAAEGKGAFFRIKLIQRAIVGTINGATGGSSVLSNGLKMTFPANALVNAATHAAYTGTVNIAAYWMNPTASDLQDIMPGDLRGINDNGKLQLLTSYGMAVVELTGSAGQLLQIAATQKATLSLPIPTSMTSSAPSAIALWYFDESNGLWKQEGIATRYGNNYVGDVSHFSTWNCDIPANFIQLNAKIVFSNGQSLQNQPLQNAKVKISVVGNASNYRYAYTDSAGYLSFAVPQNTALLFEVYGNLNCATVIYSQNLTTATTNMSLGTISVSNGSNIATITGNVVDCSNAPVTNGYVIVGSGNYFNAFRLSNTGAYTAYLLLCSSTGNSVTFTGENLNTFQESNTITRNVIAGNNVIPTLQTCNTALSTEFVHLIINNAAQNYDSPPYYLRMSQNASLISIPWGPDPAFTIPGGNIVFTTPGLGVGSTQTLMSLYLYGVNGGLSINNPPVNVSITECGIPGIGFVAGNFTGNFTGASPANIHYNITCSFRVLRFF